MNASDEPVEFEDREFLITTRPLRREADITGVTVMAKNPLDALDKYAVRSGFVPYSQLEPLDQFLGFDRFGLWGVMGATTIYALPAPVREFRPIDAPIQQIELDGLIVSLARNTETGQFIVLVNSEATQPYDGDGEGRVYIEVTLDGGTLHDYDQEAR